MLKNSLIILIFIINAALAQPHFPILNDYVTDLTNTLSNEQLRELNSQCSNFYKTHGIHVAALVVPALEANEIGEYALKTAELNKLGNKEYNNGVLILIEKKHLFSNIQVGYEPYNYISPALISSIKRNIIAGNLVNGDYTNALSESIAKLDEHFNKISAGVKNISQVNIPVEQSNYGLRHLFFFLTVILLLFFKKQRGLGTLFFQSALKGRKRFEFDEYEVTGFKYEIDKKIDPAYLIFRQGGLLRSASKRFVGRVISGTWQK